MHNLIPLPREIQSHRGTCAFGRLNRCSIAGLPQPTVQRLKEDFPDVSFALHSRGPCQAVFSGRRRPAMVHPFSVDRLPVHPQGYVLTVRPELVSVRGVDAAGLWHGLQTLKLLSQDHDPLPCVTIRDWPALPRRGIHIDLKGYQPRFERLKEFIRLLARYKINTILLEVEDKFAYQSAPGFAVPEAYTAREFRELGRFCQSLCVEVIPKLQCLGHVDYLLRLKRYAHLRENGHPYQYCPRHPGTFQLWSGMAAELLDCFPDHPRFHVGGDETAHLSECPVCRAYRKADNYVYHVGRCLDFVRAHGRTPILWDDILRNLHGHLAPDELERTWVLGDQAILMYWAYGYGGRDNTFPFLRRYLDRGMRVWGASGFSGCGPGWFQNIPPLRQRAWNVAAWTKSAIEHKLEGVISTGWTRITSCHPPTEIPEACWPHMLYVAESTWRGQERDFTEFGRVATRSFFGTELPEHLDFIMDLDPQRLPATPGTIAVSRQAERFRLLCAAIEGFAHENARQRDWMSAIELLNAYTGRLGGHMPDYGIAALRQWAARFLESLRRRAPLLEQSLRVFYEPSTVREVLRSRFGRDHRLARELRRLVARTRPV